MIVNNKNIELDKHNIKLDNRNKFFADGVNEVLKFDENLILLDTNQGKLTIKGSNIKIDKTQKKN